MIVITFGVIGLFSVLGCMVLAPLFAERVYTCFRGGPETLPLILNVGNLIFFSVCIWSCENSLSVGRLTTSARFTVGQAYAAVQGSVDARVPT